MPKIEKPIIFSWNMKNVNKSSTWMSKYFIVKGTEHEFRFVIYPLFNGDGHVILKQRHCDISKSFNLYVELKFSDGLKKFSWGNVKKTACDLGILKINDLLQIKCVFSDIRQCTEEVHEVDKETVENLSKEKPEIKQDCKLLSDKEKNTEITNGEELEETAEADGFARKNSWMKEQAYVLLSDELNNIEMTRDEELAVDLSRECFEIIEPEDILLSDELNVLENDFFY